MNVFKIVSRKKKKNFMMYLNKNVEDNLFRQRVFKLKIKIKKIIKKQYEKAKERFKNK